MEHPEVQSFRGEGRSAEKDRKKKQGKKGNRVTKQYSH